MEVGDLYAAFALFSVLSSIGGVWLIRSNPAWAYLASLVVTCVLTHAFLSYRFDAMERGPLYIGAFMLAAMFAAMGLIFIHAVLRIALDLMDAKSGMR